MPPEPKIIPKKIQALQDWWKNPTNREKMKRSRNGQYEAILAAGERECIRCHIPKPLSEFPAGRKRRNGQARYGYCKKCHYAYQRVRKLIREFNLTVDDYETIVRFQKGVCAICGRPPKPGKALSVDHCHITGLVRGGLCWLCNRLLGIFRDSPEQLQKALDYLKNPPATVALGAPRYAAPGRVGTKKRRKLIAKFPGSLLKAEKSLDLEPVL